MVKPKMLREISRVNAQNSIRYSRVTRVYLPRRSGRPNHSVDRCIRGSVSFPPFPDFRHGALGSPKNFDWPSSSDSFVSPARLCKRGRGERGGEEEEERRGVERKGQGARCNALPIFETKKRTVKKGGEDNERLLECESGVWRA